METLIDLTPKFADQGAAAIMGAASIPLFSRMMEILRHIIIAMVKRK